MFSRQTPSSNSKGLLVQNTVEQEEYRKRTVAIQRELRAMAVSLSANRRRFLKRRAELVRRSTLSLSSESSPAMVAEKRKADELDRGDAGVRALSAVLERPRDESTEESVDCELDTRRRQEVTGDHSKDLAHDETRQKPKHNFKKTWQDVTELPAETVQDTSDQSRGGRLRNDSFSKYRQDAPDTVDVTIQEAENQSLIGRDRKYSFDESLPMKTSQSSVSEALRPGDPAGHVVNKRNMIRSPRSARSGSVAVTLAPPPESDDAPRNESSVISRRMRGMTVGATEQLDLSRLRQIYDVHIGSRSPNEEQDHVEHTHRRIKDFLERTSAESVVSDTSDLASESGSVVTVRRPSDRRRSVSRVYSLEPSPRLRKRSVPVKLTGRDAIHEEEEDTKDKLRLPPLSLPPVHSNVPMKLLPRNFSKRGQHHYESTRIWTSEEWEDLKHCRYLRHKSTP